MAKYSFKSATWTPIAVADTASMTNQGFMGILGGSTTQVVNVLEVYMGGQAGASSPSIMIVSRDSTVEATPGALTTGESAAALHPSSAALAAPTVAFTRAGTLPQRAATLGLLNLSYNAFGGIVRWVAAPGEELTLLGNTASLGEISLSAYTGGTPGLTGSHIIYEAF